MAQNSQGASAPVDTFHRCSGNSNGRALFRVATDLPANDTLEFASCYLAAALDTAELVACNEGEEASFAVVYLVEMAKAAIDSVISADLAQRSAQQLERSERDLQGGAQ